MEDSGRRRGCLPARTRRAFTRSPAVPPAHQACSAGPPERPQGAWPVAIVDGFAGVAATVCCGGRRRGRQSARWRRLPDKVVEQRSCSGNVAALVDCDNSVQGRRFGRWRPITLSHACACLLMPPTRGRRACCASTIVAPAHPTPPSRAIRNIAALAV